MDLDSNAEQVRENPFAKRVTLADVALHSQVSRATASLVLRNAGSLSDGTRDRVRASMDALGYVYHRGAASLRSKRTQSVGLIVSDFSNGFTAALAIGIETVLAKTGVVTLTANTMESPARQDLLVRSMLERQVDGLLVIPAIGSDSTLLESLVSSRIPAVIASREMPHPKLSYVGIDNAKGGRLAGEHVMFHGADRVAYLGGFAELGPRPDRVRGVLEAMRSVRSDASLFLDIPGQPDGAWGLATARRLIHEGSLPDAIICHNDLVAFGVYRALRELAPELSKTIHVLSFDDVAEAALWEPPLTTVAASGHQVGELCAEALLRRIADPRANPERSLITPNLVIRESCGCRSGSAA